MLKQKLLAGAFLVLFVIGLASCSSKKQSSDELVTLPSNIEKLIDIKKQMEVDSICLIDCKKRLSETLPVSDSIYLRERLRRLEIHDQVLKESYEKEWSQISNNKTLLATFKTCIKKFIQSGTDTGLKAYAVLKLLEDRSVRRALGINNLTKMSGFKKGAQTVFVGLLVYDLYTAIEESF